MKDDFEAIKAMLSSGWRQLSFRSNRYMHETAAKDAGLPNVPINAAKCDATERKIVGHAYKAWFVDIQPLNGMPTAFGATRAEAAARLICEAREYLKREKNAEAVVA